MDGVHRPSHSWGHRGQPHGVKLRWTYNDHIDIIMSSRGCKNEPAVI